MGVKRDETVDAAIVALGAAGGVEPKDYGAFVESVYGVLRRGEGIIHKEQPPELQKLGAGANDTLLLACAVCRCIP